MSIKVKGSTLPKDSDGASIQVAYGILTEDETGTPVISPFTTVDASVKTLVVPANAVSCVFTPVGGDINVGENTTLDGTGTGKGFTRVPDGSTRAFPVAGSTNIHFKRNAAADPQVSFYFERLQK